MYAQKYKLILSNNLIAQQQFTLSIALIWANIEQLQAKQKIFLTQKEQNTITYFSRERALSYLLGRMAVYLLEERNLEIEYGVLGFPVIVNKTELGISISHSGNMGGCILYSNKLLAGIDIEVVQNNRSNFLIKQLNTHENPEYFSLNIGIEKFALIIWTIKEALSKALKCGLGIPFEFLTIKSIVCVNGILQGLFENFPQYQFIVLHTDSIVMSLVIPKILVINNKEQLSIMLEFLQKRNYECF